jgi:hypothetical protein
MAAHAGMMWPQTQQYYQKKHESAKYLRQIFFLQPPNSSVPLNQALPAAAHTNT